MVITIGALILIIIALIIVSVKLRASQLVVLDRNASIEEHERELRESIDELMEYHNRYSKSIVLLQNQKIEMENAIRDDLVTKKTEVAQTLAEYQEEQIARIRYILKEVEDNYMHSAEEILESYNLYKADIDRQKQELTEHLEDQASLYVATITTLKQLDLDKQALSGFMIQISDSNIEDIDFLIKEVVPKMNNPQLLNKLIWTEYIMKPTGELLKRILPNKDCAGIYKITHVESRKSYIGRSTSVYKRIQEHVKSALGVGTIADQYIHTEMRRCGLTNFMFELIEECPKDKLSEREKHYIDFFDTNHFGYNANLGG